MRISWMVLAEAVAQDSKGAYSLIGLGQNVLFVGDLPSQTKRAVVVHIESGNSEANILSGASFTFSSIAPDDAVLNAQSGQIQNAEVPFPELDAGVDIPFETIINITTFGDYRIRFRIVFSDGTVDETSVRLHVLPASRNPQFSRMLRA